MKKKYEVPTIQVVEFLHDEDLLIAISSNPIQSENDIRSESRGWDNSIWSEMNEEEEE